jgi:hypothetical protein
MGVADLAIVAGVLCDLGGVGIVARGIKRDGDHAKALLAATLRTPPQATRASRPWSRTVSYGPRQEEALMARYLERQDTAVATGLVKTQQTFNAELVNVLTGSIPARKAAAGLVVVGTLLTVVGMLA